MKVIYPNDPFCDGCKQPVTHTATLTFRRDEIVYDIENYAFVEGDIMPAEDPHLRHQVFDIAQDGNVDRVNRILNLAVAETVELLYPYTKEEITDDTTALDDTASAPDQYTITLTLPEGFSSSTATLLSHLIHEYLVCRVLQDWLSITYPGASAKWEEKAEVMRAKVRTALLSRTKAMRRKMKPF